jgi:hypothetical protein
VTGGGTVTCSIDQGVGPATPFGAGSKASANLTANTTFTLTCGNGVGPNVTKSASVTVAPKLSVSPVNVYLGTVLSGETRDSTTLNGLWVTITNIGGSTLIVSGITFSAPSITCVSGCTPSLAGGASLTARFRLTAPSAVGPFNETATISSNGGTQLVTINADIIPMITINPGPLDFGNVILGKFKDLPLVIRNHSTTASVPEGNLILTAPFTCATSCHYNDIPPGGSAVITVRYAPTVLGQVIKSGTLDNNPVIMNNTGIIQGTGVPLSFKIQEK